jgi:hypothetical protein
MFKYLLYFEYHRIKLQWTTMKIIKTYDKNSELRYHVYYCRPPKHLWFSSSNSHFFQISCA